MRNSKGRWVWRVPSVEGGLDPSSKRSLVVVVKKASKPLAAAMPSTQLKKRPLRMAAMISDAAASGSLESSLSMRA